MADPLDIDKTIEADGGNRNPESLLPGSVLGQYKVIRLLGRGGMGEVYEVEHEVLGLRYALKLLPSDFASKPEATERFKREARVMAQLKHPNIVNVDDFGEIDGRCWLRMELMNGINSGSEGVARIIEPQSAWSAVSLEDLAKIYNGKVPEKLLFKIVKQIASGLSQAHKRGTVHRDLKPSNILFDDLKENYANEPRSELFKAKISDFGLVQLVGEEWMLSQAKLSMQHSINKSIGNDDTQGSGTLGSSGLSMLGTFEYMSPEQKRGEDVDSRSDIYSLGLMIFKLLTGQQPGLKPPSRIVAGISKQWDIIVRTSLEEQPEKRYQTAEDLMSRLERLNAVLFGRELLTLKVLKVKGRIKEGKKGSSCLFPSLLPVYRKIRKGIRRFRFKMKNRLPRAKRALSKFFVSEAKATVSRTRSLGGFLSREVRRRKAESSARHRLVRNKVKASLASGSRAPIAVSLVWALLQGGGLFLGLISDDGIKVMILLIITFGGLLLLALWRSFRNSPVAVSILWLASSLTLSMLLMSIYSSSLTEVIFLIISSVVAVSGIPFLVRRYKQGEMAAFAVHWLGVSLALAVVSATGAYFFREQFDFVQIEFAAIALVCLFSILVGHLFYTRKKKEDCVTPRAKAVFWVNKTWAFAFVIASSGFFLFANTKWVPNPYEIWVVGFALGVVAAGFSLCLSVTWLQKGAFLIQSIGYGVLFCMFLLSFWAEIEDQAAMMVWSILLLSTGVIPGILYRVIREKRRKKRASSVEVENEEVVMQEEKISVIDSTSDIKNKRIYVVQDEEG